jgi:hypothetical protein
MKYSTWKVGRIANREEELDNVLDAKTNYNSSNYRIKKIIWAKNGNK